MEALIIIGFGYLVGSLFAPVQPKVDNYNWHQWLPHDSVQVAQAQKPENIVYTEREGDKVTVHEIITSRTVTTEHSKIGE